MGLQLLIFIIIVLFILQGKKQKHYYVTYTCKWCKSVFKHNAEFCPKCKLDNDGFNVGDRLIQELRNYKSNNDKRINELEYKFNRFQSFTDSIKNKFS